MSSTAFDPKIQWRIEGWMVGRLDGDRSAVVYSGEAGMQ